MDRDDEKTYSVMDWLGLRDAPRWGLARPLGIIISVAMLLLWALALAAAVGVLLRSFSEGNTGLGAGGLIVALLGAPFLIWSTVIKHNTLAVSRQTLVLSETALFNDKVNAALGGLYSRRQITRVIKAGDEEKVLTEWEDDIVQRNGAIDRLEGLANERPSEVPRIANMLSVYVRELSNGSEPKSHPRQRFSELIDPMLGHSGVPKVVALSQLDLSAEDVSIGSLQTWAENLKPFRTDVEKAAQTLGRLLDISGADQNAITIDMRDANLQGFDLKGLCFAKAKLQRASMEGANLEEARIVGAWLYEARMEGSSLWHALMQGARLSQARMDGANLCEARMEGANLSHARMEGAGLIEAQMEGANLYEARLEGADLSYARVEGAKLWEARIEGADLTMARMEGAQLWNVRMDSSTDLAGAEVSKAALRSVDFSAVQISLDQINSMFGDASVILPNDIGPHHKDWPAHWPKIELEHSQFNTEWEKWKADPAAYVPPVKPDTDD